MEKSNYNINTNYDFLLWYGNKVSDGYEGYTTYELQEIVDKVTDYYVRLGDDESMLKDLKKIPANLYRFFSCYYRKNINYDLHNTLDIDTKSPRQDTVDIYDFETKSILTIYYDEAGKFYNIYDNKRNRCLYDRTNMSLRHVYSNLNEYRDRYYLYELDDIMITHNIDVKLRERLAFMIDSKLRDLGFDSKADKFRNDASYCFGVSFDKPYDNVVQKDESIHKYKVKCKELVHRINNNVK